MSGNDTFKDLHRTMERRTKVEVRIVKALEHWPRERAMSCIMSWMSIVDLEEAAKTICKDLED